MTNQLAPVQLTLPAIDDMYTKAAARLSKCEAYTAKLLAIEMTDANDTDLQTFVSNCNTAIKQIQDERMVYTKKFDEIKSKFTSVENGIKASATKIQDKRNAYATAKALEQKKKEAEAQNKIARDHELIELRRECEMQLAAHLETIKQQLSTLFAKGFKSVTSENYLEKVAKIKEYPDGLPKEYNSFKFTSFSRFGHELEPIAQEVRNRNAGKYAADWAKFIHELRSESLAFMQSKKAAGFANSVTVHLDVNTTVDTKQIEIQANVEKTMATFAAAPEINEAKQPLESVKISITDKLGYQAIAAYWFSTFLVSVDFEGLEKKTLLSMMKDCEKHAKTTGEQITSDFITYEVVYKASNSKK